MISLTRKMAISLAMAGLGALAACGGGGGADSSNSDPLPPSGAASSASPQNAAEPPGPAPAKTASYSEGSLGTCAETESTGWESVQCAAGQFTGTVKATGQSCSVQIDANGKVRFEVAGRVWWHQVPTHREHQQGLGHAWKRTIFNRTENYVEVGSERVDAEPVSRFTLVQDENTHAVGLGDLFSLKASVSDTSEVCETAVFLPEVNAASLRSCPQGRISPFEPARLTCLAGNYRGKKLDANGQATAVDCTLSVYPDGKYSLITWDLLLIMSQSLYDFGASGATIDSAYSQPGAEGTLWGVQSHVNTPANDRFTLSARDTSQGVVAEWSYAALNAAYSLDGKNSDLRCRSAAVP